LIRQGNYYEPLYTYKNNITLKNNRYIIGKLFNEYDPKLLKYIQDFFKKVVKPFIQGSEDIKSICRSEESMPQVYKMSRSMDIDFLIKNLKQIDYNILYQVVNFQNKVIGIVARDNDTNMDGFIPCYPTSIKDDYKYVFMVENTIWNTYENTITFLTELRKQSGGVIRCKPVFLVVEDESVVGIITETNQFVQLSEPYPVNMLRDNEINILILSHIFYQCSVNIYIP
jgi:hypothetical protein